jgi:ubiquinone/menaquinone biosynthesis C-methylase UbiE
VPLLGLSAEEMPFQSESFDVVVCLEAIYYFPNAKRFIEECRRVLRPGGLVLLCTANKEWRGFATGALTTRYFSAQELSALLEDNGFQAKILGAFPDAPDTLFSRVLSLIRATAVSLHMIPATMRAKEPLKRVFYGHLLEVPAEITLVKSSEASVTPITPDSQASTYKVIYAIGRRW